MLAALPAGQRAFYRPAGDLPTDAATAGPPASSTPVLLVNPRGFIASFPTSASSGPPNLLGNGQTVPRTDPGAAPPDSNGSAPPSTTTVPWGAVPPTVPQAPPVTVMSPPASTPDAPAPSSGNGTGIALAAAAAILAFAFFGNDERKKNGRL